MSSDRAVLSSWAVSAREAVAACISRAAFGRSRPGSVLVTGSSGKGTTCRMLAEVMRAGRLHPVLADDARRWPGTASALVRRAGTGRMRWDPRAIGLVEVDPASLPHLVRRIPSPAALVCTNVIRSQAEDDYAGAALSARIKRAIRSLPPSTTLILNADDPQVADMAADLPNPRVFFGMSDPVHGQVRADPTADLPCCPRCGGRLSYACVYYAHLGHWACSGCGLSRPEPDVSVTKIGLAGLSPSRIQVAAAAAEAVLEVPLPGMYNVYNALAAVTAAMHLGLPAWSLDGIENVSGGPMRMERTRVAGHDVYLAVTANATGFTAVLHAILGAGEPRRMLLGLSARRYPQQDISWIWDVDFEALAGLVPAPVVCGNRAADLGVRLKYAGWLGDGRDPGHLGAARIEPDPIRAVRAALCGTPPGQPLWIVSTASALAEIRRWLRHHDHVQDLQTEESSHVHASRRLTAPLPIAARLTGTQKPGPQPSGPPRSPQPTAPPPSRPRPDRGVRRGWSSRREQGQAGAAR